VFKNIEKELNMKAYIDEGCIGCRLCADACGEVFRMNDEDLAEVYGEVTENNFDSAKEAEEGCPADVIRVEK